MTDQDFMPDDGFVPDSYVPDEFESDDDGLFAAEEELIRSLSALPELSRSFRKRVVGTAKRAHQSRVRVRRTMHAAMVFLALTAVSQWNRPALFIEGFQTNQMAEHRGENSGAIRPGELIEHEAFVDPNDPLFVMHDMSTVQEWNLVEAALRERKRQSEVVQIIDTVG